MKQEIPSEVIENVARQMEALAPSPEEVQARYGHLIVEWQKERQQQRRDACTGAECGPWQGFKLKLIEGMTELIAGFLVPVTRGVAEKTTGAKSASNSNATSGPDRKLEFIQSGADCHGKLVVVPAVGGKVRIEFSLTDINNQPITPFRLTIEKGDGEVLLNRKETTENPYAPNKHFEIDDYLFLLESADGKQRIRMGWQAVRT